MEQGKTGNQEIEHRKKSIEGERWAYKEEDGGVSVWKQKIKINKHINK